jgi:MFS family permease
MKPTTYKHYVLGVLTIILLFNSLDRVALGVLLQDIKVEFLLSDTQLGFLTGLAFALFYAVMGIPIARWADRGNRVTIIACTTGLWCVAVTLCGLAGNFSQLLLIRVFVAVGEAGCVPLAFSLMADYFTRAERPRAVAIYGFGGTLSGVLGLFFAGWLNELYGWRTTFVVLGAPGVLLALIAWITLKEPRRQRTLAASHTLASSNETVQPSIATVCLTLWGNVTFLRLLLCLSGLLFFNLGIGQWLPTFFIRSHGFTTEQLGTWLAVVTGVGGLLGAYGGGELASRYAANNERLQLLMMGVAVSGAGVAAVFAYFVSNPYVALVLLGVHMLCLTAINGPLFATMQTLVPERMRAMAFAIAYLIGNLLGMGLGPLAAGALSDLYQPWAHEESLRYALLTLAPGYFLVAWQAWRASRTVAHDVAAAGMTATGPAPA